MMKKFKYLLLVFVAFLTLNMSAKAATLPELFITMKSDYLTVGKKLSEYDLDRDDVLEIPVGNTIQLEAYTAHGNDLKTPDMETGWFVDQINLQGVNWSSNNTSVATVDSNGLVTTVGEGQVSITATYDDKTADFKIKVGDVEPRIQLKEEETKTEEPVETIGETTPKSEEPTETIGETEDPTVVPTETNEETKTDVKKEEKECKIEVYEIVIIACAVVLLIALITVLVIRKKKANKETM